MLRPKPKPDPDAPKVFSWTPKRLGFVREYPIDRNQTDAATRAGFSLKTAAKIGCSLMKIPEIRAAIDAEMEKAGKRSRLTVDGVLEELAIISHSNVTDYKIGPDGRLTVCEGVPESALRAVASFRILKTKKNGAVPDIKLWNKVEALSISSKYLGMSIERHELSGPAGGPIPLKEMSIAELTKIAARGKMIPPDDPH